MVDNAKRRRRGTKVTRKPKARIHKRIVGAIINPEVKKLYDKTKNPRENFQALGLALDSNKKRIENTNTSHPAFIGYLEQVASSTVQKERKPITDFEERYIELLLKKCGENIKKMVRDIELNSMQYTEAQLRKIIEKYKLWQEMKVSSSL